jgi:phage baseplate assembly protein W
MATVTNTITNLQKTYVDLDFNFLTNPGTGDVTKKTNIEDVKQSVRNLLMTKMHERPFQPNLYSGIYDLLFEPFTGTTKYALEKIIRNLLGTYEPRISVLDINIADNSVNNGLDISLTFEVIALAITTTYSVTLERTR